MSGLIGYPHGIIGVMEKAKVIATHPILVIVLGVVLATLMFVIPIVGLNSVSYTKDGLHEVIAEEVATSTLVTSPEPPVPTWPIALDTARYDQLLLQLADYTPPAPVVATTTRPDGTIATTTKVVSDLVYASSTNVTVAGKRWPAAAVYPNGGALLPFNRILAYYGNFHSIHMGVLGEYEPNEVLARLASEQAAWEAADPETPVLPAIEYIAMVAQADAGRDGMYRATMSDAQIDKAYDMAQQIDGIMILDLQVGLSTIQKELPQFRSYLSRPDVHLAIDPEFSMKYGNPPGTVVGTYDATDVNWVIDYLSDIVREYELPPKVLIVHRFTQDMVTNAELIEPTPEVQVVMVMDGWGSASLKRGTYSHIIEPEPVQFTGIKLFYKNDLKPPSTGLLTPAEVLSLDPKPIYIQYQ